MDPVLIVAMIGGALLFAPLVIILFRHPYIFVQRSNRK